MKTTLHLLTMPILKLMKTQRKFGSEYLNYLGNRGENIIKSCTSKIQRFLTKPVKFIVIYDTKRTSIFVSNKDRVPPLSRSNLVYEVSCRGCGRSYIGMTKRCLWVRLKEHGTQLTTSAIGKHLSDCEHAQYLATKPVVSTQWRPSSFWQWAHSYWKPSFQ
jgi:hypothetical protein